MTALTEYERLEASGLWRPSSYQQRRDVVVSVGDATLAIYGMDERPLAHWSLPAIERRNPGTMPAIYAPGPDAGETLEIDDELMISAIERVHQAIERGRPRRGRLRFTIFSALTVGLLALAVFWLPGALVRHAASVVPPAVRADTGLRLLRQLTRVGGPPCRAEIARRPLDALSRRLLGAGGGRIVVIPGGFQGAVALPGRLVAVDRTLVEDYEGPGPLAGHVVAALARAELEDPIARLLRVSGPLSAVQILTRGEVSDAVLRDYAERIEAEGMTPLEDATVLAAFEEAGIGARAYAEALDITGASTAGLIAGDPGPDSERPLLTDSQWVALQSICEE